MCGYACVRVCVCACVRMVFAIRDLVAQWTMDNGSDLPKRGHDAVGVAHDDVGRGGTATCRRMDVCGRRASAQDEVAEIVDVFGDV